MTSFPIVQATRASTGIRPRNRMLASVLRGGAVGAAPERGLRPPKSTKTSGGTMAEEHELEAVPERDFRRRAPQGGELCRAGRGRHQPPVRLGRTRRHRDRGGDVAVPPLCGLRHRPDPAAALHPCRLRAGAVLPAVSGRAAVPQPHPLVGRRARRRCRSASSSTRSWAARTSPTAPRCRRDSTSSSA